MIKVQRTYQNQIATLYLVATPIGDLKEVSLNVIQILKKVTVIFCEDTRVSCYLLKRFQINTKIRSFHKFNEKSKCVDVINTLSSGNDVALLSCAGAPLIADPGFDLVVKTIAADFNVTAVGINSAFLAALICSGLTLEKFSFYNFLLPKKSSKEKQIKKLLNLSETVVCYDSVHRLKHTLLFLQKTVPERQFCLAREISKRYETFYRGKLKHLEIEKINFRGEFVLILGGNENQKIFESKVFLDKISSVGLSKKQIIALGKIFFALKRKHLYQLLNEADDE